MNEKNPEMQAQDYHSDPRELEQTKLAVVGDAAAFRSAVNLLATKAKNTPENEGLISPCSIAARHHHLKQPSWRQTAGYEGPPGRPGLRRWSPAGLDLCLWYAGDTDDGRKTLRDEFVAKMGALRSPSRAGRTATPARSRRQVRRSSNGRTQADRRADQIRRRRDSL